MADTNQMEEPDQTESMAVDQSSVSPFTFSLPVSCPSYSFAAIQSPCFYAEHLLLQTRAMEWDRQVLEHNSRINSDTTELPNIVDDDPPRIRKNQYDASSPNTEPALYLDGPSTIGQFSGDEYYHMPFRHTSSTFGTTEAVWTVTQPQSLLPTSTREDVHPSLLLSSDTGYVEKEVDEIHSRPDSLQQPPHSHFYAGPSQTYKGRKTASRQPGVVSGAGAASYTAIDNRDDIKHHTDSWKDELQTDLHANAPSSLLFNGDMEGRPLRMMPAENSMADIVISPPDYWNPPRQESQKRWPYKRRKGLGKGEENKDLRTGEMARTHGPRESRKIEKSRYTHSVNSQQVDEQSWESESETGIDYSSNDEPWYYPRRVKSSANLMPRPQRVTARRLDESNRLDIINRSTSNSSMQIQQINDDSSSASDQRTPFLLASTIDANTVDKKIAGMLPLDEEVGRVQCEECHCSFPHALPASHYLYCLNRRQRIPKKIREAKEAKEVTEFKGHKKSDTATGIMEFMEIVNKREEFTLQDKIIQKRQMIRERKAMQEREEMEAVQVALGRKRDEDELVRVESRMDPEWKFVDNISAPSSYANSVTSIFTTKSLRSSASYLSRDSGYSEVQVLTATKELLSIVLEDHVLLPIYKSAIEDPYIGPERLQRNLRRLFKVFANLLEKESTERLEFLASQLVLWKSKFLAHSIVDKLRSGRAGIPDTRNHDNSSDDDDDGDGDRQSETRPVNEDAFEDLAVFREFLIGSDAFKTLRANVQAFVTPKLLQIPLLDITIRKELDTDEIITKQKLVKPSARLAKDLTWKNWLEDARKGADLLFRETEMFIIATVGVNLAIDAFFLTTDHLLITMGLLEPTLKQNTTRFRWQCSCGEKLHCDVMELRAGGVEELVNHMERTSSVKVHTAPYNQHSGNQRYIAPHPVQWIQNAMAKIGSAFSGSPKPPTGLPQHNPPQSTTTCSAIHNASPQQRILRLLTCMHRDRFRKVLYQDVMEKITTDRTLLCFLQKQYFRHRSRFLHVLSLERVKGIFFVKLRLPIGGSVDVRHHDPCCIASSIGSIRCECIPPPPKVEPSPGAEYVCIPGPPATYPLIPPEYLASLLTCPTDVHEQDTWILDQMPKRTRDELRGQIGQPAEGWGIYHEEGLDRDMITLAILVVFILASVLFGILWSRFHFDIQGAFGVSSYMVACCAIFISFFATRVEKLG